MPGGLATIRDALDSVPQPSISASPPSRLSAAQSTILVSSGWLVAIDSQTRAINPGRDRDWHGLDNISLDSRAGRFSVPVSSDCRTTSCLLARLLALALEVPGRSRGRSAAGAAAHGSRLLLPPGFRPANPAGKRLGIAVPLDSTLHFPGLGVRLRCLQLALHGAARRRSLREPGS